MDEKVKYEEAMYLNNELVRGYYVKLPGSPVEHFIFICTDPEMFSTFICGGFDLSLN